MTQAPPILKQSFKIIPQGHINSGSANYIYDPMTELLQWAFNLNVSVFFFSENVSKTGQHTVDSTQVLSSNFIAGAHLDIAPLHLVVVSTSPTEAMCDVTVDGQQVSGTATLDISQEYISLKAINATGTYDGIDFVLEAIST